MKVRDANAITLREMYSLYQMKLLMTDMEVLLDIEQLTYEKWLEVVCHSCGDELEPNTKHCPNCHEEVGL